MEKFKYEARDKDGNRVTGVEAASERGQVITKLRQSGLFPINITQTSKSTVKAAFGKIILNDNEKIFFTRQVSNLLDSGLPLIKAISLLSDQTNNAKIKRICLKLHDKVSEGSYLWQAMDQYPETFDKTYTAMVKAAEMGADMEKVFNSLADFMENKKDVKDSFISMMLYPAIILAVGIITVFFLMTFIVPKMAFMFESQNMSLPFITKALLSMSMFLSQYWIMVIAGAAVFFFLLRQLYIQKKVNLAIDRYLYLSTFFGRLYGKIVFSRFCYIMGLLLNNGISVLECLQISRQIMPNMVFKNSLAAVTEKVRAGAALSASMKQDTLFPLIMADMIGIGEQTGQLEKSLHKVSVSFDKQVKQQVRQLLNILEPAIILFMALIVGLLVAAILLPVFQFNLQTF